MLIAFVGLDSEFFFAVVVSFQEIDVMYDLRSLRK